MDHSASFVALHTHHADVHAAERGLAVRRAIAERRSDEPAPARERVSWWHRRPQHALRLAAR